MSEFGVLQEGRMRRSVREAKRRRARRRRRIRDGLLTVAVGLVALLLFMASGITDTNSSSHGTVPPGGSPTAKATPLKTAPPQNAYLLKQVPHTLRVKLKPNPTAGLLFDIRTGQVLWARNTTQRLPIASLTKMMTALVVVAHSKPSDQVMITRAATHFSGSGVGMLPLGKKVPLEDLLYGLLLPSGNDAAIALAQYVAGTQQNFVAMMNEQARRMGLSCTHFSTVSGIVDLGNYSCANDLAVIAHAVVEQPNLRQIVATSSTDFPFPIKRHKLFLYNNNPLMHMHYPGVDGVKTGYTTLSGLCIVGTARRGNRWYGVVLLHTPDWGTQAEQLLNAAFAARV
jgi:serine-type D-Ala-D-Ala carboxypeptidase (penicillin-binding protein 5/6)